MYALSLGFGTARFKSQELAFESVERAIEVGYRHLDTAKHYAHTEAVGDAIRAADVARDRLTVATKLHSEDLGYNSVISETDIILDRLGLDYVDVLYVHWPAHSYDPKQTFAAMDILRQHDKIRQIGVCNFTPDLLDEAVDASPAPVAVHQIEMHPFLPQDDLLEFCHSEGIQIVAHTPLAGGRISDSEVIQTIADDCDATVQQIALSWLLQRDAIPIPKSTGEHIAENYAATDISPTDEEIAMIDSIEPKHRVVDYDFAPWN